MKYTTFDTVVGIIEQNENVTLFENDGEKRFFDTDGHYYVLNFATEDGKEKNFYVSCDDFSLNVEEYIDASDEELCEKIDNGEYLPYSADYSKELWKENFKKYDVLYIDDLYQYERDRFNHIKNSINGNILEQMEKRNELYKKISSLRLQGAPDEEVKALILTRDQVCSQIVALREKNNEVFLDYQKRTIEIYDIIRNTIKDKSQLEI